jgi:hypothetical protein
MKIHTYNQLSPLDCIEIQSFLQWVKGRLDIKLIEAKLKYPNLDYSEQELIIDYLEKTICRVFEVEKGGIFLLKEAIKTATIITDLENKVWKLEQINDKQTKEIENIKENINSSTI